MYTFSSAPSTASAPAPAPSPAPAPVAAYGSHGKREDLIALAAEVRTVTNYVRKNMEIDDDDIWILENEDYEGDGGFYAISETLLKDYKLKPYDPENKVRGMKVVILEDANQKKCTICFMERDHYTEDCPNINENGVIDFSYQAELWCMICRQKGQHYTWNCPHARRGPQPCKHCGVMDNTPTHNNALCALKHELKKKKEMKEMQDDDEDDDEDDDDDDDDDYDVLLAVSLKIN